MIVKRLLLLALFASATSIGHGQILLLNDTFSGSPESPLDTTLTPTTPNAYALTPETWTADSSITTDGTEAVLTDPTDVGVAIIGIPGVTSDLTVGATYTLKFTLATTLPSSGPTGQVLAGFISGGASLTTLAAVDDAGPNFNHVDYTSSPFFTGINDSGNSSAAVVMTLLVGAGDIDTLGVTVNGTPEFSESGMALGPLNQIILRAADASGTVQDLSLSVSPEPSTYAMMLGGFILLGFLIRRKAALPT